MHQSPIAEIRYRFHRCSRILGNIFPRSLDLSKPRCHTATHLLFTQTAPGDLTIENREQEIVVLHGSPPPA